MTPPVVTDQERRLTLLALMVVFLLSALDQTIVSTAMPRIIEQLQGFELYAWVTTSYMLTSTVMVPIYGKLSDLYGRKPILLVGVVIFLLGSFLCGLSGEFGDLPLLGSGMVQLVIFRALQGFGGAALFSSSFSIIADLYSPRERGKLMGLFGGIFGLAGAIGPLVGGFCTDHGTVTIAGFVIAGWRWVFYVNLPLGFLSLFLIIVKMPRLSHRAAGEVDYLGAALFIIGVVPLLLALTWGGYTYAWDSPRILGLLAATVVGLGLFLYVEAKVRDPLLPLSLFRNKVFSVANASGFLTGMAFLGVVMFLPLFSQIVQGINATETGFALLPIMLGLILSSSVAGYLVTRTGQYKSYILGGLVVLIIGLFWLWDINPETTPLQLAARVFVVGLGLGPSQSLFNIAVQNAVPVAQMGIATSASQFFRQMGSIVGLSIFGTLLTHNLMTELPKRMPTVPGMEAPAKMDLSAAQSQAMDLGRLHREIAVAMDKQYVRIEKAYTGDAVAQNEIINDAAMPDQLKALVKGRTEADADAPATRQMLGTIKQALHDQGEKLVAAIERAMKESFAAAITGTFGAGLWIIFLALVAALFLPALPLRQTSAAEERAAAAAE